MFKKVIPIILIGLLLCSCGNTNDNTSITETDNIKTTTETTNITTKITTITTTEVTTAEITTIETTTTADNTKVAKQLAKDSYIILNNVYDKCSTHTTLTFDAFQITSSDNLYWYTIKDFCEKYNIPYDFVYDLCVEFYNNYKEKYPSDRITLDSYAETFIHYYAKLIVRYYFNEIDLYKEIQTLLDDSKEIIKEITALDINLPYLDSLTNYYTKLNSYQALLNDSDITYKQYFDSTNELKIEIEAIKAELELYLT